MVVEEIYNIFFKEEVVCGDEHNMLGCRFDNLIIGLCS